MKRLFAFLGRTSSLESRMAQEKFSSNEARQLLEIVLRNPDPQLVGVALRAVLAVSKSPSKLIGDAIEAAAGEDLSGFFRAIRQYGRFDLVLAQLGDERPRVRETVVKNLGWISNPSVLGPLEEAMSDADPAVRSAAAKSFKSEQADQFTIVKTLSLLDSPTVDSKLIAFLLEHDPEPKDLPTALAALNDSSLSPELKRAIASKTLGIFRERTDRLFEILENSTELPSTQLIDVLDQIRDSRAVRYLLRHANALSLGPFTALCRALGNIGGDEAARSLIPLVAHRGASAALTKMGAAAAPHLLAAYEYDTRLRREHGGLLVTIAGPAALPALIAALNDPDPSVRHNAESAVYRLGELGVEPLLRVASGELLSRPHAISVLSRLADKRALPAFIEALSDPEPNVRRNAETGLCRLGEVAVEPLLRVLASRYLLPRPHAISALSQIADRRALRPILEIAADSDDEDHHLASEALSSFAKTENYEFLTSLLRSGDSRLQYHAARALARSGDPDMAEVLYAAAADPNPAVRVNALLALQILAGQKKFERIAVQILIQALADPDPDVMEAADHAIFGVGESAMRFLESIKLVRSQRSSRDGELMVRMDAVRDTLSSPGPTSEPPAMHLDEVTFSATAPSTAAPGESFLIDFWAHLGELTDEVVMRARAAHGDREIRLTSRGPVKLARDTAMRVRLSIPSFGLANLEDTVMWTGRVGNTSFPVTVPKQVTLGTCLGYFSVFLGPLQISQLHFEVRVTMNGEEASAAVHQRLRGMRVRSAFASYATEDRNEVMGRLQGMLKVFPNFDVFLDVLSLRSGDSWEERIHKEILARDIFYLFWSVAASRSPWVDKEWRTALTMRGLNHIDPVPLQPASVAPPPHELAALHFSDWTLAINTRTSVN